MHSHIGCICAVFPLSDFSNMSSNGMPEQMHTRIGCTCIPFLQSVLWNVFSNDLPQQMHSHIGYIYMAYLLSGSSNEPSNYSHQRMHSRIGCTCMSFLQSGFSHVSSNGLPGQMHSCIGCTCIPLLQSVFSNESSNYMREQMNSHIGYICTFSLFSPLPCNRQRFQKKKCWFWCRICYWLILSSMKKTHFPFSPTSLGLIVYQFISISGVLSLISLAKPFHAMDHLHHSHNPPSPNWAPYEHTSWLYFLVTHGII